jgi:hypothetical protein
MKLTVVGCLLLVIIGTVCIAASRTTGGSGSSPEYEHKVITYNTILRIADEAGKNWKGKGDPAVPEARGNNAIARYLDKESSKGWELYHSYDVYLFFRRNAQD